jgi:hypothetical protein
VIAAHLGRTGGVAAGSFVLDSQLVGGDRVAAFTIPLSLLSPPPRGGLHRVFVFSGTLSMAILDDVTVPADA